MGRKVWIEAAVNGPWGRSKQPGIPVTPAEIVADGIACAAVGAAIVHVHAYDEASGRQRDDWQIYAHIIEGIRARADVIVYPTIPLAGSVDSPWLLAPEERFAAVEALARRGLIEWASVDPGSVNFTHYDEIGTRSGFVYLNPEEHVRHGLALAARHGFRAAYACYEPGFVRLGAALHRVVPEAPTPLYRLFFSQGFTFSFPPEAPYLVAYHRLLQQEVPAAPWMAAGLAVDLRRLVPEVLRLGGHLRVGLEDAPFGCGAQNPALVEDAVAAVEAAGYTPATAPEVRAAFPA